MSLFESVASKKNNWKSVRIVKLLQIISQVLGLSVPNLYNYPEYEGLSSAYIFHSVTVLSVFLGVYLLTLQRKYKVYYPHHLLSTIVLDILAESVLLLTIIVSMTSALYFKRRQLISLVNRMARIENQLVQKCQETMDFGENKILSGFITFLLVMGIISTIDIYAVRFLSFEIWDTLTYSFHRLQIMFLSVMVAQVHLYCCYIQSMLKYLHRNMYKNISPHAGAYRVGVNARKNRKSDTFFYLKKCDEICDLIDTICDFYRWQLFFMFSCITLNILYGANLLVNSFWHIDAYKVSPILLFMPSSSILEYITFGMILAISCGKTAKEARRSSIVSFFILMSFSSSSTNIDDKIIKEELMLLAEHIEGRNVQFSIGFFPVDKTLLFTIFGVFVTYITVLLQFK